MVSVRFWGMVCVVALCASVTLSDVIIDDFEDGAVDLTVWSGDQTQPDVEAGLTGVIGGTRDTPLEWDVGEDDVDLRVNRRDSGRLAFSSDPVSSGTMTLTYGDGIATLADITEGGANDRIRIRFDHADHAGTLTITVTDDSANVSTWTGATPEDLLAPSEDVLALFSAFINIAGTDMSSLVEIQVELGGAPSGDYLIEDVVATPEPASAALLASGAAVLLLRRRRRQG